MASIAIIRDGLHVAAHPTSPGVGIVTAEEARLSQAAGWAVDRPNGARTGIVYVGIATLLSGTSTSAPSMTVAVAPLTAVCQKAPAEGVYTPSNVGTTLLDIAAAPGSNSRIDVVYILQRDASSTTAPDTLTQAELGVVTGTAAVSPVKPALPAGAVEAGTVTVPAGATATTGCTIATTCLWTAPLGTPVPCRNATERNGLTGYDGLTARQLDTDQTWVHNGVTWALAASGLPLAFHAVAGASVPAGNTTVSVGSVTASGAAVTAGYLAAAPGNNVLRVLRPCMLSLTALFYIPQAADKQGAIGIGALTYWWVGSGAADRLGASLHFPFTSVTDIVFSQRGATAAAGTTLTIDGYLIPMD